MVQKPKQKSLRMEISKVVCLFGQILLYTFIISATNDNNFGIEYQGPQNGFYSIENFILARHLVSRQYSLIHRDIKLQT